MKKPISHFLRKKKIIFLTNVYLLIAIGLIAQPNDINVSGCSSTTFNGNYSLNAGITSCNSCTSYEKVGGGAFLFREEAVGNLWAGTTNAINCFAFPFVLQNGETDCDPTNGGVSVNGCIINSGLPVDMMWFEAKAASKNSVELSWEVSSETNNEGFEIERSLNGLSFEKIGFVAGRGNADDAKIYSFIDEDLAIGKVYYYRLKQIDWNAQFEYFDVVSVALEGEKTVFGEFFPNPTSNTTSIEIYTRTNEVWNVEAYDLSGKQVWSSLYHLTDGRNQIELELPNLNTGLYFFRFENEVESIHRKLSYKSRY